MAATGSGDGLGDVAVLGLLGAGGLTLAAFWLARRLSKEVRQRAVARAAVALGGVLLVLLGVVLADTAGTGALFSSVGSFPSGVVAAATEFTPSAVAALSPSPGAVSLSWTAPQGGGWVRGYNVYRRGDGVTGLAPGVVQAGVPTCAGGTTALCLVNGTTRLDPNVAQPYFDPDPALSQVGVYLYVIRAVRDGEVAGTFVEVPVNSVEVAVLPDPSTPGMLVTWPPAGATGIPTNTTLAVQFDRPMSPLTVNPSYTLRPCLDGRTCTSLGAAVPLGFEWTAQYTLLLVTPQALLAPGTWHRVGIASGATDLGGNPATPTWWAFEVASGAAAIDATVPQVVGWDPPSAARDVRFDHPVTLLFSKPMNMVATNAAVSVCAADGACLPGLTFRWDTSATLLEVGHPAAAFAPGKGYRVVVTTAARDAAGNQVPLPRFQWPDCPADMAECAFASGFTVPSTAASADLVAPPYLASASPDAGARDVPFAPNATMVLQFSKAMARETLKGALTVCPPTGSCAPDLSFGWEPDGKAVTVFFKDPLVAETTYQVVLTARATDLAGAPLARAVAWSFTTAKEVDKVAPRVVAMVPVDGQLGVALAAPLVVTFSEAVQWTTVRSGLSICVADDPTSCVARLVVSVGGPGLVVVEHPLDAFRPGKAYRVRLGTSVRDLAMNVLVPGGGACPAGDGTCGWASTFTTVATADVTPPVVVAQSPVDGAGTTSPAAPATAPITLTFSEPMDRQSVERAAALSCAAGPSTGATAPACTVPPLVPIWGLANSQVSFTHAGAYTGGSTYRFRLTGEARDISGNSLNGTCPPRLSLTATSGPCDLDAFTATFAVAATTGAPLAVLPPPFPMPEATDVATTASLVVTFGRAVAPASAQGALRVECAPAGCVVPTSFRYAWNAAGTVMTATPATSWTPGATYVVTLGTGVMDASGLAISPDEPACAVESGGSGSATGACAYRWRFTVPVTSAPAVPLAPIVSVPVATAWTGAATATVSGCVPGTTAGAATGTCSGAIGPVTVELWRDAAGDGVVQAGADVIVATRPLAGGLSSWGFVAPLEPASANRFTVRVVNAQGVVGPGASVPVIWQSDVATTVGTLSVLPGPGTLAVSLAYSGDAEKPAGFSPANRKNAAVVEWGDTAVSPAGTFAACGPGNAGRCPMVRTATGFDALVTGLNLSTPYPVRVVVTDADGVTGEGVQVARVAVTGSSTGGLLEGASVAPLVIASRMGQAATVTARVQAGARSVQVRVTGPGGVAATSPCLVPATGPTGPEATWTWSGRDAQDAYVADAGYVAQVTAHGEGGCTGAFQSHLVPVTVANAAGVVMSPDPYTVTVAPGESAVVTAKVVNSQGNPVAGPGGQVAWKASGGVTGEATAWLSRTVSEVGTSYPECGVVDGLGQACVRLSVPLAANAAQTIVVTASAASQTVPGVARVVSAATSLNDPPGAPASLSLTAGSVNFAWRGSIDPRVVGYKVYVGTLPGVYDTILDAGKSTSYHWDDTLVNQVYYAVVRSYDALGLVSAPTNEARIVAKSGRLAGTPAAPLATATAFCAAKAGAGGAAATPIAVVTAVAGGGAPTAVTTGTTVPGAAATSFVATTRPGPTATAITCANVPAAVATATRPTGGVQVTATPVPVATVGVGTPIATPGAPDATPTPVVTPSPPPVPTATPVSGPPAHVSVLPPPSVASLGPGESLVLRAFVTDRHGFKLPDASRTVVRWRATLPGNVEVPGWLGSSETRVGTQSPGTFGACSVPAGSGQSCTILLVPKDAVLSASLEIVAEATGAGMVPGGSVATAIGSTQVNVTSPRGLAVRPAATMAAVPGASVAGSSPTVVATTVPTVAVPSATPGAVATTVVATATTSATPTPTPGAVSGRQPATATRTTVAAASTPSPPTATRTVTPTATALVAMTATPMTPSPTRTVTVTVTVTPTATTRP